MFCAGIDIGSVTTKVVVLGENTDVLNFSTIPTSYDRNQSGKNCFAAALAKLALKPSDIKAVVATGYGRRSFSTADHTVPEIICHGRGTAALFPEARTIIDIGGQDSKVIAIDHQGATLKFEMNDKCAAGTGRFLEVLTDRILNIQIDALGPLSLKATAPCVLSSMCTVFAESEIVSLLSENTPVPDIAQGMHLAIAKRVVNMGRGGQVEYREQIVFSGGVAKNSGVVRALESVLKKSVVTPEEPQITGALGAALIARDRLLS